LATHVRHATAMTTTLESLKVAQTMLGRGPDGYDLVAAELRMGILAFEVLVGRIDTENLLDEVFSSFCIGK